MMVSWCFGAYQDVISWACNIGVHQCIDCCGCSRDISAQHVLLPPRYLLREKARFFNLQCSRSPLQSARNIKDAQ